MRADRWLLLCVLPFVGGCIASNVVAEKDRAVVEPKALADVAFRPANAADFAGLFETVEITGDVALSLRRVWYWFESNGRYSGAAFVDGDEGLSFQTLTGTWKLTDAGLALDDGEPLAASAADGLLRMAVPGGTLVLKAVELR